jgi:acyl-coenzyme A synthetase/AMP-(fatty) acid ligase
MSVSTGAASLYEDRVAGLDWAQAAREIGFGPPTPLNIGWHCTDRPCESGPGAATALIWEDSQGRSRRFTYDQRRLSSSAAAEYLRGIGVTPGDRV